MQAGRDLKDFKVENSISGHLASIRSHGKGLIKGIAHP